MVRADFYRISKKIISSVTALLVSAAVFAVPMMASAQGMAIALNHAYAKSDGTYTVVAKYASNARVALYVNDTNPTYTNANKQGWATFRGVSLPDTMGKLSFTRVYETDGKSYQKPINYARYYAVANSAVTFSKTNQAAAVKPAVSATPSVPVAQTPAPQPTPEPTCTNGTYVNSSGNTVCSPEVAPSVPAGATAQCVDGTYSFSQSRSGTCSHHGGVSHWL